MPGSLRPFLLPGGVLTLKVVCLAWHGQVKTSGLAREAGRRRMSAPGRVPGLGAGYVAGEGDLPGHGLACKEAEGQRMFWRLHFAWRCAIKIMECGSIIRALPVEKKALAGKGVLLQQRGERPTPFAPDRLRRGYAAAICVNLVVGERWSLAYHGGR